MNQEVLETGCKTREEIEALIKDWIQDPFWDVEETPGFEAHWDELTASRFQIWKEYEDFFNEKIQQRAEELNCSFALAKYIRDLEFRISWLEQHIADLDE